MCDIGTVCHSVLIARSFDPCQCRSCQAAQASQFHVVAFPHPVAGATDRVVRLCILPFAGQYEAIAPSAVAGSLWTSANHPAPDRRRPRASARQSLLRTVQPQAGKSAPLPAVWVWHSLGEKRERKRREEERPDDAWRRGPLGKQIQPALVPMTGREQTMLPDRKPPGPCFRIFRLEVTRIRRGRPR